MDISELEIEIDDLFAWESQKNQQIFEFLIKKKGIWKFNKFDKDPFPSKPHGHNIKTGEKLDINTGIRYDKQGFPSGKLRMKNLLEIREQLKEAGLI